MREIFPRNLSLSDEVKGRCANSMVQIIKFPVPASKFGFKRVKRRAKAAQDPDQLDLFPKTTAQILDFSSALSRFEQALMLDERGDLKAAELYRKAIEKKPDNPHPHILLGEAYVTKGMPAEGLAMMQKGMALDATLDKTPERWDRYPLLAYAYAAAGRRVEALKILDEQKRLAKQRYVSPYNFAIIYTGLGDKDRAFEWFGKACEERSHYMMYLQVEPSLESLRSDPRYQDLLRQVGLER